MKTAEEIRNLQREVMKVTVLNAFMADLEEYAKENPQEKSYEKYIYDREDYLDGYCLNLLEEAGYGVYHREISQPKGEQVKHQYISISW